MKPPVPGPRSLFSRARRRLGASPLSDLLIPPSGEALSGLDLLLRIDGMAGRLSAAGIEPGSRVLVALSHPLALILALPALWSLDCIPLLADGSSSAAEIEEMARRMSPDHLLGDGEGTRGASRALHFAGLPPLRAGRTGGKGKLHLPGGTVLVRTTSGSTGPPRGVALSAPQILADALNILASLRIPAGMRGLAVVPLSHAFGFSTLLTPLLFHGQPLLLLEDPVPEHFRSALRRHRSLFFPGVPFLYDLVARAEISRGILAHMRLCISAGAPLPAETARRFREASGSPVRNFYGTSECGAIASDRSPRGTAPAGCVGRPLSGVKVSLGRAGRILVRGEAVALGYVEGGSRPRLFRGRFLTEDMGRIDSRKRLHVLGRLDALISVGGRKVFPAEVERVLRAAPGVKEVVAVGILDASRGEAVAVAVESSGGAGLGAGLLDRCRRRLAPHKVPRRLRILPCLPRTARGKIDVGRIRTLLQEAPPPPRFR